MEEGIGIPSCTHKTSNFLTRVTFALVKTQICLKTQLPKQ